MANFPTTSLMDVFNAVNTFGANVLNTSDKWNMQKAEIELTAMQNQFNEDLNAEMMKIQSSNNWEDWQGQIDDFMNKTYAKTSDKSDSNPYYCRNAYTAQQAKEMLDRNRIQAKQQVEQLAWKKETEHMTELYNKNRESDRTNLLLTPQQRYENGLKEAKILLENGRIGEASYNKEADRLFQQTYSDSYVNNVSSLFDLGIQNGWSIDKIIQEAEKNPVTMKKLGLDGLEEQVDLSQLKSKLNSQLSEDYEARVKDIQDQNAAKLSAIYRQLTAAETESAKLSYRRQGQAALSNLTGGFYLDENRMNEYAYKFKIDPIKDLNSGAGGNGGGGGGAGGGSGQKAQSWSFYEKSLAVAAINEMLKGNVTEEGLIPLLQEMYLKEINDNNVKEIQNASPEDVEYFLATQAVDTLNLRYLHNLTLDEVFKDPAYGETKSMLDNLLKDIEKNPDKYGDTTWTWVMSNAIDFFSNGGLEGKTPKEVKEYFDKISNSAYSEKLDKMAKKYKVDEYGIADIRNTKQRNEYFANALDVGENNDVVYGNKDGIHWRSEKDQQEYDKLAKTMTYDFANIMGVDPSKVRVDYKKDKYGDELPLPMFTINGESYYPRTVKDKKGKATSYEYVNEKTGKVLTPGEWNSPAMKEKAALKQQRDAAKKNEKVAKAEVREVYKGKYDDTRETNTPSLIKQFNQDGASRFTGGGTAADKNIAEQTAIYIDQEVKKYEANKQKKTGRELAEEKQKLANRIGIPVGEVDKWISNWKNTKDKGQFILKSN